jgi:hypothetical protein
VTVATLLGNQAQDIRRVGQADDIPWPFRRDDPRIVALEAELAELRAEYAAVLIENEQLRGRNRELCLELGDGSGR